MAQTLKDLVAAEQAAAERYAERWNEDHPKKKLEDPRWAPVWVQPQSDGVRVKERERWVEVNPQVWLAEALTYVPHRDDEDEDYDGLSMRTVSSAILDSVKYETISYEQGFNTYMAWAQQQLPYLPSKKLAEYWDLLPSRNIVGVDTIASEAEFLGWEPPRMPDWWWPRMLPEMMKAQADVGIVDPKELEDL